MTQDDSSAYSKFQFDNEFFDIHVADTPRKNKKNVDTADLEEAKAEAFAAGKAEGLREAEAAFAKTGKAALQSFDMALSQLPAVQTAYLQKLTEHCMHMMAQSLEIVIGDASTNYPQDILNKHLLDILPLLPKNDTLIMKIHPDARAFHEKLAGGTANIQDQIFKIETDPQIALGDCVVLWPSGGMDATLAEATRNLRALLDNFRPNKADIDHEVEGLTPEVAASATPEEEPAQENTEDETTAIAPEAELS